MRVPAERDLSNEPTKSQFRKFIHLQKSAYYTAQGPNLKYKKHPDSEKISDDVMKNGILIGCHQGLVKKDLNYITKTFIKFINKKNL